MEYRKASQLRKRSLLELIAEKKFEEGLGLGTSISTAISQKFKAKAVGMQESMDPLKWISALTGNGAFGKIATTVAGRAMGRSDESIDYFGGYERKGGKKKIKNKSNPQFTTISAGPVVMLRPGDSIANILGKMYNFMAKTQQRNKLSAEIEVAFRTEQLEEDERRHKKVIDALLNRGKVKPAEDNGVESFIKKLLDGIKGMLAPIMASIKFLENKLTELIKFADPILKAVKSLLFETGLKSVIGSVLGTLLRPLIWPLIAYAVAEYMKGSPPEVFDLSNIRSSSRNLPGMGADKNEPNKYYEGRPEKITAEGLTKYDDKTIKEIQSGDKKLYEVYLPGYIERQTLPLTKQEAEDLGISYRKLAGAMEAEKEASKGDDPQKILTVKKIKNDITKDTFSILKTGMERFRNPPTSVVDYIDTKLKYPEKDYWGGMIENVKDKLTPSNPFKSSGEETSNKTSAYKDGDMAPDDSDLWKEDGQKTTTESKGKLGLAKGEETSNKTSAYKDGDMAPDDSDLWKEDGQKTTTESKGKLGLAKGEEVVADAIKGKMDAPKASVDVIQAPTLKREDIPVKNIPGMIQDNFPVEPGEWNKPNIISANKTNNYGSKAPKTVYAGSTKVRDDSIIPQNRGNVVNV
jgi:hypothetical protein